MSPIILDPDYNPYLSSSGMDSEGMDVNEALANDAYSTPCGRPDLIAPQLHTFPRSLSSSSNGSTTSAGSLDSIDSYPGGPSEENPMWVHHYDIHVSLYLLFSVIVFSIIVEVGANVGSTSGSVGLLHGTTPPTLR